MVSCPITPTVGVTGSVVRRGCRGVTGVEPCIRIRISETSLRDVSKDVKGDLRRSKLDCLVIASSVVLVLFVRC